MVPKSRIAMATAVAALVLALMAMGGCTTKVITAPAGAQANTVTASGMGVAQATPDVAEMSFGVWANSRSAKTALDDASKAAEKITAAMKKTGVDVKDIQTRDVNVSPQYGRGNKITGYQAALTVRVKVRDLNKLGEVISAANAAGSNNIGGPVFTVADPAPTRAIAIDKAVADARKNAEAMAKAVGKSVGAVVSMSSTDAGSVGPGPMYDSGHRVAAALAKVPIEPGQLDITMSATVVYELK